MLILAAVLAVAAAPAPAPAPVENPANPPLAPQAQQQPAAVDAPAKKSGEPEKAAPDAKPHCRVVSVRKLLGHEVTHTKCD